MKKKTILFGIHPILEAIKHGESLGKIWIKSQSGHREHRKIAELARAKSIPCSYAPPAKLRQLTSAQHQGVVACLAPRHFLPLSTLIQETYQQGRCPLVIIMTHIEDTRNLGAVIRSAVAAQVDALVIPTRGTPPIDGYTMKASAGALAHMPIAREHDLAKAIEYLVASGLRIVACTEKATQPHYHIDLREPTAWLLGGEAKGISPSYLAMSHAQVRIPMLGPISSLNLSVATSVVLYETMRQRHFSG